MRDVLGPGTTLGYCTNVHAGESLAETIGNLERYSLAVKKRVSADEPMGVGLWLSAQAARELLEATGPLTRFRDWLDETGLEPFTLNGFPYGDFHGPEVKYRVYAPDWRDPARPFLHARSGSHPRRAPGRRAPREAFRRCPSVGAPPWASTPRDQAKPHGISMNWPNNSSESKTSKAGSSMLTSNRSPAATWTLRPTLSSSSRTISCEAATATASGVI